MTPNRRDAIIDDLLKKLPKKGSKKITYESKQKYCYDRRRYIHYEQPSCPYYGYDPKELFSLDIKSKAGAVNYMRERFFPGKASWDIGRKKSTITRRANRLWSRIEKAISDVKDTGGHGVYKVIDRNTYNRVPFGHVYGANKAEARATAQMSYGYFARSGNSDSIDVEFLKLGSIEELSVLNAKTSHKIN